MESRLEGFARLDALHGVWLLRLRDDKFSFLHDEDSQRGQRSQSASGSLEGASDENPAIEKKPVVAAVAQPFLTSIDSVGFDDFSPVMFPLAFLKLEP